MIAVDTNVLVYRLDLSEPVKRQKARSLLRALRGGTEPVVLLWQVAGEFIRYLRSQQDQGRLSRDKLLRQVRAHRALLPLVLPTPQTLDIALDLAERYSLSHWDSMIVAACVDAGVHTLYTEDMGAPTRFDSVELLNPFI